jgi:hypothetical protein
MKRNPAPWHPPAPAGGGSTKAISEAVEKHGHGQREGPILGLYFISISRIMNATE